MYINIEKTFEFPKDHEWWEKYIRHRDFFKDPQTFIKFKIIGNEYIYNSDDSIPYSLRVDLKSLRSSPGCIEFIKDFGDLTVTTGDGRKCILSRILSASDHSVFYIDKNNKKYQIDPKGCIHIKTENYKDFDGFNYINEIL